MPQEQLAEFKKHIEATLERHVTQEYIDKFNKKFGEIFLTEYLHKVNTTIRLFEANTDLFYAANTFMPKASLFYADRLYVSVDSHIVVVKVTMIKNVIELKATKWDTDTLLQKVYSHKELAFEEEYMKKVISFLQQSKQPSFELISSSINLKYNSKAILDGCPGVIENKTLPVVVDEGEGLRNLGFIEVTYNRETGEVWSSNSKEDTSHLKPLKDACTTDSLGLKVERLRNKKEQ